MAGQSGARRDNVTKDLVALTRLWAFDAASPTPAGMPMPPWNRLGVDDFLPVQATAGRGHRAVRGLMSASVFREGQAG
ncbi:hypothetical protein SGFS_024650 [Streptomyces graminofaciens]|uniref:Uncharacterized protein n=1 Tax=Streptomyces graminofaciens TaxID=68212 RepID=A0ABN5VD93_9ACTN|nr:hypothetical protein SGFS_024650 [Streptomyces graminofaciens]